MLPQTFDAYIPGNLTEFVAAARFQPTYIALSTLRSTFNIEDAEFNPTVIYSKDLLRPLTFTHCSRAYYFALYLLHNGFPSNTPGVPQITFKELNKRIFLACMLHDIGLSEKPKAHEHPAHAMSFELHGGIMAYDHLHAEYPETADDTQVGDIVQGIMLHTTPFSRGMSSAMGMLLQTGARFDVMGYDALGKDSQEFRTTFNRKTVGEIQDAYPRGDLWGLEVDETLGREAREKRDCIFSHNPPDLLERAIALKSLLDAEE